MNFHENGTEQEVEDYGKLGPCGAMKWWEAECPFCHETSLLKTANGQPVCWCDHLIIKEEWRNDLSKTERRIGGVLLSEDLF